MSCSRCLPPQFIAEYDTRPNRLYFEYLVNPKEVGSMLWQGYKGVIFASLLMLALGGVGGGQVISYAAFDRCAYVLVEAAAGVRFAFSRYGAGGARHLAAQANQPFDGGIQ
jgi:phosphoglycerol transferase MdoB-like AlkP superfamily enzyme